MTDFEKLKYEDPKDAVRDIYHTLMYMVESYCERARNLNLDDAFIEILREKYTLVEDILKYNMLEIPYTTYSLLYSYCVDYMTALIGKDWREALEKNYAGYLKSKNIKEAEGEEWYHIDGWCKYVSDAFYDSMSQICRNMFNTHLLQEGVIAKIKAALTGQKA